MGNVSVSFIASFRPWLIEIEVEDTTIFSGQNTSVQHSNYTVAETTTDLTTAAQTTTDITTITETTEITTTGQGAVLHWSFDNIGHLVTMEGESQVDFDPIVPGKVGGYYRYLYHH